MMRDAAINVQAELSALELLDKSALVHQWTTVFGCPAPRHSQAPLLRSALAWHCQMSFRAESGTGGVDKMIRGLRRSAAAAKPALSLAAGTRLLREWQGQTHHVTVVSNGYEYGGKIYRSLTAITRLITGTAWSGPLFFGLKS